MQGFEGSTEGTKDCLWPGGHHQGCGSRALACSFALLAACVALALIGAPAQAADPVIAAAGDIACDTGERVLQRRLGHRRPLPPAGHVGPARGRGPLRGADAGRHPVPRRRPGGLRGLLRPDLGTREADHPPDRRQPRVRDIGRAGLLRLLQRARPADRPRRPARQGVLQLQPRRLAPGRPELEL